MVRKLLQGYNEQKSEGEESEFYMSTNQMDIRDCLKFFFCLNKIS